MMTSLKDTSVSPAEKKASNKAILLERGRKLAYCTPDERIVISGISGDFPESESVQEFGDKLMAKVDLITDDDRRWKLGHPEVPQRTGKIKEIRKFDAAFFGIHYQQAHCMDPMARLLLEKSYEAIVDAGFNPKELSGSNMGVFLGACFSESEKTWFYENLPPNGLSISGCSRAMYANRVSYWLGTNGPSYTIDTACSSSLYALEHAYKAIRDGLCDSALVGGCNLCLHPYVSLQFARLGVLSLDGRCKCFDENANGYCRAEAVCVVMLQKIKDARRVYAKIIHAKTNCDGFKVEGITYPSGAMQKQLLEEFYEECDIKPSSLAWVEAHGTGTKVGDPEEVRALDEVFTPGRTSILKIGSVKSNMGHSEPASGLCSIAKVIIAMERLVIPPNINLSVLRSDIEGFHNGKISVITEPTPWEGGMVGVNSFGFGGANCHILLDWNPKTKINNGLPQDDLPRLVTISGRTEEAANTILSHLETNTVDVEFIRLLQEVHKENIPGHMYRGYAILRKDGTPAVKDVQYFPGDKPPVWFIFSSFGSEWPELGKSLLKLPLFHESIIKSHNFLKTTGLNLLQIMSSSDNRLYDDIRNSFVSIVATQIAFVDILKTIGVSAEGLVGYSLGEFACAYADGSLTAEQAILASYYLALVLLEKTYVTGTMASVGIGYSDLIDRDFPSTIDIASDDSPDNCTISGPSAVVDPFIESLRRKGVSVEKIQSFNIPFQSHYVAESAQKYRNYLKKIIPKPTNRSEKWISCSSVQDVANGLSDASYFANIMTRPVHFQDAIKRIPSRAVVIEISPNAILETFTKQSLGHDALYIPLMEKSSDSLQNLLTSLGRIYEAGANLNLAHLYPHVEFPVSRGTSMIAPLIRWEHSENWYVTKFSIQDKVKSGERAILFSLKDDEYEYIAGHVIDGRNLYPATAYLTLAWETLALMKGLTYTDVPVVFENVRFNRATNIPKDGTVEFTVLVQKGSGNFEIVESNAAVVTGKIYLASNVDEEMVNLPPLEDKEDPNYLSFNNRDIYKELRLRGYNYKELFRAITYVNNQGTVGKISWENNFVAFMDNMLQMQILQEDTRGLFVPTYLQKLIINTKKHFSVVQDVKTQNPDSPIEIPVYVHKDVDMICAGGIEIKGLKASVIAKKKPLGDPVLEKYVFMPYFSKEPKDLEEIITVCSHIALENIPLTKVKTIELLENTTSEDPLISPLLVKILGDLPLIQADVQIAGSNNHPLIPEELDSSITVDDKKLPTDSSALLVVGWNLLNRVDMLNTISNTLKDGGFVISREKIGSITNEVNDSFRICLDYCTQNERIVFLRKASGQVSGDYIVVDLPSDNFEWVPKLQKIKSTLSTNQKVVLLSQKEPLSGILGFFNCIRRELNGENIRCVFIMDNNAPDFSLQNPLYKEQLSKDLAVNVYKYGSWGSYRHIHLQNIPLVDVEHAFANTLVRGDLSSLAWVQGPFTNDTLKCDSEEFEPIQIYYASMNFRDVMIATGKLSVEVITRDRILQECVQGFEYSGRSLDGTRYMGLSATRAMSNMGLLDKILRWKVPDNWTLEEAATVPAVYGTVFCALLLYGKMKKGDKVLIHSGTGGVGQAAINLCQFYGCEVFTTVGTQEKKEFILKTYPHIPESHIGNSRDLSFEMMVMSETNGKGVDIVLNSLAEEKLQASLRCLGYKGRFLEIGKFDLAKNNTIGMEHFLKGISFHGVMLDNLFLSTLERKRELNQAMQVGLETGAVKPLIRTIFEKDQVEQAFRYMAAGKHIGKVLLKIRDEEKDISALPKSITIKAVPRFFCPPNTSHIVCGGLGGFGLELADWLVIRGARNLILNSRRGVVNGYQSLRIRIWRSYGCNVVISTSDITTEEGVQNLIQTANSLAPVYSIFNLAVVLKDEFFENQTIETFSLSAGAKAKATYYLDIWSRKRCPSLKQFVVFSSVSCGRGNAGQTNYGYSNSVMERICEDRRENNYPAIAIEWGAVGEVGLVADMAEDNQEIVIGGTLQQRITSCLEVMDSFLNQSYPIVASMVVAEKRSGSSTSGTIVDTVVNILGLRDLKTVSMHSTLAELGMDSMMAVEIKQTLEREFEVFLTPQDIRTLTFSKLHEIGSAAESEDKTIPKDIKISDGGKPPEFGLGYLLRLVGDEEQASKFIVRIPSLLSNGSVEPVSLDKTKTVFLIPGVEGVASTMEPLASNLDVQTLCLQFNYENTPETIIDIAKAQLKHIEDRLPVGQSFNIIGYSFGGLVSMELVRLLEERGRIGKLWLIDSSPDFLTAITYLALQKDSQADADIQVKLILRFLDLIWPQVGAEMKDDLYKCKDWESRVNLVLSISPDEVKHSKRYQGLLMTSGYNRIKAVLNYKPFNATLKTKVTLIRPTELSLKMGEDYGLSKYFASPVFIHYVEGNHFTILDNKKTADIIMSGV